MLSDELRTDALLFGETQSRIVVTVKNHHLAKLLDLARKREVFTSVVGKTGGNRLIIHHLHQKIINIPVDQAFKIWKQAIPECFKGCQVSTFDI